MIDTGRKLLPVGPYRAGGHGSLIWLAVLLVALSTGAGAQSDFDFGDAPDAGVDPSWSYPTLLVDDGARHLMPANPTHFLGGPPVPFTVIVSVDSSGVYGNADSNEPSVSADGCYVAFSSSASNLVPEDFYGWRDIFVHDCLSGITARVSVNSSGTQGNDGSYTPSISADGRYVAFQSRATNLVSDDTNGEIDVFVHDRLLQSTTRVSVDSSGVQGDSNSGSPSTSADGRYVAFSSRATNLVVGDTNGETDVFLYDRVVGTTTRVSVNSFGTQGNDSSGAPSVSTNGRYVAFQSNATNLVVSDTNSVQDVFLRDRLTASTFRVSVDSSGVEGDDRSDDPAVSSDGRYVTFSSRATNLVPDDTNDRTDVFVQDRTTGDTTLVSVDSSGLQGNDSSSAPSISADGRYVAFQSWATNLVPGDTNNLGEVFVHDRASGRTSRESVAWNGNQAVGFSGPPSISADGRYFAFASTAENLVPGNSNRRDDVFVRGEDYKLDTEADGEPSPAASGDDRDGNDDEGGVRFLCCMDPGESATVLIDASAAGFVNAWIDFGGDGDWDDSGDQILTDHAVAAGVNEIAYGVPFGSDIPVTYARVRFTSYDSLGNLGVTGLANDGEVEDSWVGGTGLFADGFELGDTSTWSATVP